MELKPGYKQTEAGAIPEDWLEYTIGDLIQFQGGSQPEKSTFLYSFKPDSIRLIQIRDYKTDKYETYVPIHLARRFCDQDDIMIGRYGPPVFQILKGIAGAYNVALIKAIPDQRLNKSFAYFYLKQEKLLFFIEKLSQRSSGQTGVDLKELRAFPLPLPPTEEEQTAIANALSHTDALIQALQKLVVKTRLLKQGTMQALFNPFENGILKNGWKVKNLGDLFVISAGGDLRKDEFSNVYDENFPYPIYSNSHTDQGLYGYCKSYDHEGSSLTITARGGVGYAVARNHKFAAIGRLLVLKSNGAASCEYVAEFINLKIEFANESTGVPQLTAPQASKYEIPLPPIEEQNHIATILFDMDADIAALEAKLTKYQQIKQGMMQNLFTGRIRLV